MFSGPVPIGNFSQREFVSAEGPHHGRFTYISTVKPQPGIGKTGNPPGAGPDGGGLRQVSGGRALIHET